MNDMHEGVVETLASFAKEAGGEVRREVVVPEFARWTVDEEGRWVCKQAILDLRILGAAGVSEILVDGTARQPLAERYLEDSCREAGVACRRAEAEKHVRYQDGRGRSVVAAAVEQWGRIGEEAEELMRMLAKAADEWDRARGGGGEGGRLRRWRVRLDAVIQRSLARSVEDAQLGPRAERWKRLEEERWGVHRGA